MRRSRIAFGLATVVLLEGGCSSDPEPNVAPPDPPPTSATPSERASPVATVRAWVKAQNRALVTGDVAALRALSAPSCQGCDDFSTPIQRVYRAGGNFETEGWRVAGAKVRDPKQVPVVVDAGVVIAGGVTTVREGAEPVEYDEEHRMMVFKLLPSEAGLEVAFVGFMS